MTIIRNGYLARKTGRKNDSKQGYRTWFLVKSTGNRGYVTLTQTITFPNEFIGKKVCFKIEEAPEPTEHKPVNIKPPKYVKPVCPHEWVLCGDVSFRNGQIIKEKAYRECLLCNKKEKGDGLE